MLWRCHVALARVCVLSSVFSHVYSTGPGCSCSRYLEEDEGRWPWYGRTLMDILGLCDFRPAVLYDSDPINMGREVAECVSLCMGMTISVTYYSADMEPEVANCYIQKEPHWNNKDTKPPTKLSAQVFSCLREMQG